MNRSEASGAAGFTLIEVLAAVLIVCLVFGLLLESVTRNLRDLSRARQEARAAQVAEDRVRALQIALESGEKLEDGVREEACDDPDTDLICQTIVAPEKLMLPADYPGKLSPSPLFSAANQPPRSPPPGQAAPEAPLRMVQVRAYPPETDPNDVDPFVVLLVAPLDQQTQQQLQQQQQQQQQQQPGTPGTPGAQTNGGSNQATPRTRTRSGGNQ